MEQTTIKINGLVVERIGEQEAKGAQFVGMVNDKSYRQLVELFGQPLKVEDGRSRLQWILKVDGIILCVYDYKDFNTQVEDIRKWHLGSNRSANEIGSIVGRLFFDRLI